MILAAFDGLPDVLCMSEICADGPIPPYAADSVDAFAVFALLERLEYWLWWTLWDELKIF